MKKNIGYFSNQLKLGQNDEFDTYSMMYSKSSNPAKKGDPLYPYIIDKKTGRIITMRFNDTLTNGRGRIVYDMRYLHIDAFTEDQMMIPVYCASSNKNLLKQPASRQISAFLVKTDWAKVRLRKKGFKIKNEKELLNLIDSNEEIRSYFRSQNTIKEFYRTASQLEINNYKSFYKELTKQNDIGLAVLLDKGLSCIDFDTPMELKDVRLLIDKYFKDCDNVIVQMSSINHHTHFFIPNEYVGVSNFTTKINGKKEKQHNTGKQKGSIKVGRRVYQYDVRKGDSFYVVVDGNGYGPMMSFQRTAKFNMSDTSMNSEALLSIPAQPVFTDFDITFYEDGKERCAIEKNTQIQRTRLILSKDLIMDNFSWLKKDHSEAYFELERSINLSELASISRANNVDIRIQLERIHNYLKEIWEEKIRSNNPERIPSFEEVLHPNVFEVIEGKTRSTDEEKLPQKALELWNNFTRTDSKTLKNQGAVLDRLYNFEEADGVKVTDIKVLSVPDIELDRKPQKYTLQQIPDDMAQSGYAIPNGESQKANMKYTSLANVEMYSYKRIIRGLFNELYKRIVVVNNINGLFKNDFNDLRHIIHGLAVIPKQKRFTIDECYELIQPLEEILVNASVLNYLIDTKEVKWTGSLKNGINLDKIREVNDLVDLRFAKDKKLDNKYKQIVTRTIKPIIIEEINDVYSRTQGHLYQTCFDVTGPITAGSNYSMGTSSDDKDRKRIYCPITKEYSKADSFKCFSDTGYFFGQYFYGEATDKSRETYGLNWMPVSLGYSEKGIKKIGLDYYQKAIDRLAEEDENYLQYRKNINATFDNELAKAQKNFDATCRRLIRTTPIPELTNAVNRFSDFHSRLWYESRQGNGEASNSIILGRNKAMEEILIGMAKWAKKRDPKLYSVQETYWSAKTKVDRMRKFFENYRNVIRIAVNELIDPEFDNMINYLLRNSLTKSSSNLSISGNNVIPSEVYEKLFAQDDTFSKKQFTFGDSLANEYNLEVQDNDIANIIFYDFPAIIETVNKTYDFIKLDRETKLRRPVALSGISSKINNNLKSALSHNNKTIYHYELLTNPEYQINNIKKNAPKLMQILHELTSPIPNDIHLYPNQNHNKYAIESKLFLFIKRIDELIMSGYFPNKYYLANWELSYHANSIKKFKEDQLNTILINKNKLDDKASFMNFQNQLKEAYKAKGIDYEYTPGPDEVLTNIINWELLDVPVISKRDAKLRTTINEYSKEEFLFLINKMLFPLIRSAKFIDKDFLNDPKNAVLFDVYELLIELNDELRRFQKETQAIADFFDAIKEGPIRSARNGRLFKYAKYAQELRNRRSLADLQVFFKKSYILDNLYEAEKELRAKVWNLSEKLYRTKKKAADSKSTTDEYDVQIVAKLHKSTIEDHQQAIGEAKSIKDFWPDDKVLADLSEMLKQFIIDNSNIFLDGFIFKITDKAAIGKAKMAEHHRLVHNNVLARDYNADNKPNTTDVTNYVADDKNTNLKELAEEINSDELLEIDNSNVVNFLQSLLNDNEGLVLEQLASNIADPSGYRDISFLNLAIYLRNHGFDGMSTKDFLEKINSQLATPISNTQLENKVRQAYKVDQPMFDKFIKENHILKANHVEEFKNINMTIPQAFEDNLPKLWEANIYKYKQSKADADDACEILLGFIPSEVCGSTKVNFAKNAGTDEKFLARMSGDISFRIDEKLLTDNLKTVNTETGEIKEYKPNWKTRKDRKTGQIYQSISGKELAKSYNEFIKDTRRNECQLRANNGKQSTMNRQFKKFAQISELLKDPLTCVYLLQKSLSNTYSGMNGYKTSDWEEIDGQETRFNVSDEFKDQINNTIDGLLKIAFVSSDIAKKFNDFDTFKKFYTNHVKFFKGDVNQSEFDDLLTKVGYRQNVCAKYGKDYINFFEKMDANQIWRCMHNKFFTKKSVGLCKITFENDAIMLANLFNDTFKKIIIKKDIWHTFVRERNVLEKSLERQLDEVELFKLLLRFLAENKNYQIKPIYKMNFVRPKVKTKYKSILKAWKDPGGKNKLFNKYQRIKSTLKLNSFYPEISHTRENLVA